jgi:hypothetical protein
VLECWLHSRTSSRRVADDSMGWVMSLQSICQELGALHLQVFLDREHLALIMKVLDPCRLVATSDRRAAFCTDCSEATGALSLDLVGYQTGTPKPRTGVMNALNVRRRSSLWKPQFGLATALRMLMWPLPLDLEIDMWGVKVCLVSRVIPRGS